MEILHILAGPVIGAVIGYCTNWVAVKMLFKPLHPVKIFGKTLPFTPGVIPKNMTRIGRACGQAISESLLTSEDMTVAFAKEETKEKVADALYHKLFSEESSGLCINDAGSELFGESGIKNAKGKASDFLTQKIGTALQSADYETAITDIGGRFIREKLKNPMISMFLNESVVASFAGPLADSIRAYIASDGEQMIRGTIEPEIEKLCAAPISDMLNSGEAGSLDNSENPVAFSEDSIKELIGRLYEKCIEKAAPLVMAELDIAGIVEEKIAAMDVGSFEELVLSVMKTELDYVVRLGALIGFVIGIINVFI